ncbi:Flp pilus assembly complex ATPase component TadA [Candidatus Woesearchaeota archaeon]|nr:Flp pilus assembly complex ATPase component TadA [Candidatus Woesearchaeota archaeon]
MRPKKIIQKYSINSNGIDVEVEIYESEDKYVPTYAISIMNITPTTKLILDKIREEFVSSLDYEELEQQKQENIDDLRKKFTLSISRLVKKYFPKSDDKTKNTLINYLLEENLGFGKIDILLKDAYLEEIVINNHSEPVWVYHKRHGWLETNITIFTESRIRHYSTMIGRDVNKEITVLNPLMDAHLKTGDRVNATLAPISTKGNTITIRKFAEDPWTIIKFIEMKTISPEGAALVWIAVQNELSILIAGGTGSGKTSMLNGISNFLPPNQRIISIEDTRELKLSSYLHWVPLETRLPNPEGKGGITMLDLLINSLRMRPDRIFVGEIRRKEEAQVLLEAMHTGHSVYATIHANNADETVSRLTNPPIDIPKGMISSLSMILVQNRNRRTGKRRTIQIAELTRAGEPRVLMQYSATTDKLEKVNDSQEIFKIISLYAGMTTQQVQQELDVKTQILKWLLNKKISSINELGKFMADYYTGRINIKT